MSTNTRAKVLMAGPDLSLKGGIVSVVDGYLEAGLPDRCEKFAYQGTGVGNSLLTKSIAFAGALNSYRKVLDDYDIVHLHISAKGSYKRKSLMAKMAEQDGKKVILHEHSGEFARDFQAGNKAYREDVRKTFAAADCVIVLSEEWRDYFADNVCDESKLMVLHNGVPVPPTPCDASQHEDILFLGWLEDRKRPNVLMRASREALAAFPNANLLFGGVGSRDQYAALADELGIAKRCEFLGWVDGEAKERLFEQAGIFCLPSRDEGMPMSVLEAMAHGVPVIATSVGGVPRLIQDGIDGYLMDVDDEERLSRLLLELEGLPERRRAVGMAGRKKVEESFGIDVVIERLVSLYEELIG